MELFANFQLNEIPNCQRGALVYGVEQGHYWRRLE